jgi:hypothetical protein
MSNHNCEVAMSKRLAQEMQKGLADAERGLSRLRSPVPIGTRVIATHDFGPNPRGTTRHHHRHHEGTVAILAAVLLPMHIFWEHEGGGPAERDRRFRSRPHAGRSRAPLAIRPFCLSRCPSLPRAHAKQTDIVLELRPLARLMVETKAPVSFEAQDAAKLRKAADEIESLYAALGQCSKLAYSAVRAERAAILELIEAQRADSNLYDGDYKLRCGRDQGVH